MVFINQPVPQFQTILAQRMKEASLAHCGDIFRRTHWQIRGERIPVWRCISRIDKRKADVDCPARTIYEKDMHAAVVTAFNQLIAQKDEFLPGMKLAVERAMQSSNSPRVKEIDERLEALQKELLKKANTSRASRNWLTRSMRSGKRSRTCWSKRPTAQDSSSGWMSSKPF